MTNWYYDNAGKPQGPVSESDLRTLLADGHVSATTRVWHEGFGTEWRSAERTELSSSIPASHGTPPPLTAHERLVPPQPMQPNRPILPVEHKPTPAQQTEFGNYTPRYATLAALVPTIIMFLEMLVVALGVSPTDPAFERGGLFWTLILSFSFAHQDAKRIAAAGLNTNGKTLVPFMFLTQIGYFLRRRSVTGLPLTPLWIWLGSFVIYVIWLGILYE